MSDELKNRAQRNKRLLFDAEAFVYYNVALVSAGRGRIDENIDEALRLYARASTSNRELIMRMTDDVYRNRFAILDSLEPATTDQTIFKTSMTNRSRIENLDHRSKINRELIEAGDKMTEAFRLIKEAITAYADITEKMIEHCDEAADRNAEYFDGTLAKQMQSADAESNKTRVSENEDLIGVIRERASGNRQRLQQRLANSSTEVDALLATDELLESQFAEILALREKVDANQNRVADTIYQL